MKYFKLKLWLALSAIGLVGIASLLLSELPMGNLPEKVIRTIPPEKLKLLILINPALMLLVFTALGTWLYDKVKFSVPVLEKLLGRADVQAHSLTDILKQGILWGIVAGGLIVFTGKVFEPYLPQALTEANKELQLSVATKVLYGGVTEELLTRFGLMSIFTWVLFKVFRRLNASIYWAAIGISALLFALGHLPVVFQAVAEPTVPVFAYILIGNSVGGLIFGYAYWKKGLECAFIAHAFAHLTMLSLAAVFP